MADPNNKFNKEYTEEDLIYQEAYNRGFDESMACFTGMAVVGLLDNIYPQDHADTPDDHLEEPISQIRPYKKPF